MKITKPISEHILRNTDFDQPMIASAMTAAVEFADLSGVEYTLYDPKTATVEALTAGALGVESSGATFSIPMLIPEELESGDGRSFKEGALSHRELPLPLLWQIKTGTGHDGSVIVGRIDSIERIGDGLGNAKGVFDVGPFGREAERLVRGGFLRGVSADLDNFEGEQEEDSDDELSSNKIKSKKISVDKGRVMAATLVAKPAFQECSIMLDENATFSTDDETVEDGLYEEMLDDVDSELAALAASAAPMVPPRNWFKNPKLNEPTPLTVMDDGRVFGHIATWNVHHIGLPKATRPPRSASNYAYFRTGVLRTDDNTDVQVGQLTLAGGHASMTATASEAVKHYDDTASAVADVTAGEDQFGIWVAGALRPDVTPLQVRALRASAPSGDWRPIRGQLELVAVCQVNVPGFPTARAMTAGGQLTALVAAGARPLAELRQSDISRLSERVDSLESKELNERREAALSRMSSLREEKNSELEALAASARSRLEELKSEREARELSAQIEALKARFNSR